MKTVLCQDDRERVNLRMKTGLEMGNAMAPCSWSQLLELANGVS
jgi:hypothetical protein